MDRVKLQLEKENSLSVARVTIKEYQELKKAERRIEELNNSAAKASNASSVEDELRQTMQIVERMKKKIEEVRELVMSTGGRRIIYESQPEVSWIIRSKSRK